MQSMHTILIVEKDEHWESRQVFDYFKQRTEGLFIEAGANHPREKSQTYFLEQQGWKGLLIEPNPALGKLLREHRPNSRVFETALCAPESVGEAELHLGVSDRHSA